MKSAHQIASQIVDAWPYSVNVKSSDKAVLVTMIAEELERDLAKAREDALEEAANIAEMEDCDQQEYRCNSQVRTAKAIRTLKEKKP